MCNQKQFSLHIQDSLVIDPDTINGSQFKVTSLKVNLY
jgi:hypothetical protein